MPEKIKLHWDLGPTRLWGYEGTFPGPRFEVMKETTDVMQFRVTVQLRSSDTSSLKNSSITACRIPQTNVPPICLSRSIGLCSHNKLVTSSVS
jgi:hypothetical protein